jgi:small subunit ribosomal protein S13
MVETKVDEKVRFLVRVYNTDLNGNKPVHHALTKIKGVGRMFAKAVCVAAKVDPFVKAGKLAELEVSKITDVLKNPLNHNIPLWMLNRRRDPADGNNYHLMTSDLDFVQSNDIKQMQKIKCYKGVRHYLGQPVRGQRTRSNFRKNKGKVVGVSKKKAVPTASSDK